jgi:hypothetical protein
VKGWYKEYLHRGQLSISTELKGLGTFNFSMTASSVTNNEYLQRLFSWAFIYVGSINASGTQWAR